MVVRNYLKLHYYILKNEKKNNFVCYFSRKLNKHQKKYSTIEKECIALLLSLQHFEVYLSASLLEVKESFMKE
jgi:hypothetical protein